jgi:hypothetical protein
VCEALVVAVEVPSPHEIVVAAMLPSTSVDPAVEAVTDTGATPVAGVTLSFAVGG